VNSSHFQIKDGKVYKFEKSTHTSPQILSIIISNAPHHHPDTPSISQMVAGDHFGCKKFISDYISCHFRQKRNFIFQIK
jgi:hypothetical protein